MRGPRSLDPHRIIEMQGDLFIPDKGGVSDKERRNRDETGPECILVYRKKLSVLIICADVNEVAFKLWMSADVFEDIRMGLDAVCAVGIVEEDQHGTVLGEAVVGMNRTGEPFASKRWCEC